MSAQDNQMAREAIKSALLAKKEVSYFDLRNAAMHSDADNIVREALSRWIRCGLVTFRCEGKTTLYRATDKARGATP